MHTCTLFYTKVEHMLPASLLKHARTSPTILFTHAYILHTAHSSCIQKGADLDCFKALIAFGANINPRNKFNQTPLDLAAMAGMGTHVHIRT